MTNSFLFEVAIELLTRVCRLAALATLIHVEQRKFSNDEIQEDERGNWFGSVSSTSDIKSSFSFLDEFFNVSKRQRERKREVEIEFIEGQQSVSTLFGPSNDHLERRIHLSKIKKKPR